jgi:ferrous iron transport protein B
MTEQPRLLEAARQIRADLGDAYHDSLMESIFTDAARIADASVTRADGPTHLTFDRRLDRLLTHPIGGFVAMGVMFFVVFWITITGANIPSQLLSDLLLGTVYGALHSVAAALGAPSWLAGLLIDGVYLATAWVVAVMLPPMAIFFPLFTLLEDFGFLPRVAFNLDALFARAGAHGKQSLTMMMGFGCNAAGIVSTRIIDSPRERLIAILTNTFSICNGRWPTLILISTIFIAAAVPPALASFIGALSVVAVAGLGIVVTLIVSKLLSATVLRGEASVYSLELPPYRPPQVWATIRRSVGERTLMVLWRAITMAAPAGAVIWLVSNVMIGDQSIAALLVGALNPLGLLLGLNGIILLAYIVAIPANEIVIPTILMLTMTLGHAAGAQAGVMVELSDAQVHSVLTTLGGWTLLTAINLMLFSLLHYPCSTTLLTIYHETRNLKWTIFAALMPLGLALGVTFVVAMVFRLFGWA